MKKYLVIICLMVGLTASAQNGEVFSVLKLEPQATAPTNAFWTNGSLYRHTDGTIYHKVGGSWVPFGETTTVINNLTSTSTTSALSAAQGKVLQDSKLSLSGGTMTGDINMNYNKINNVSHVYVKGTSGTDGSLHINHNVAGSLIKNSMSTVPVGTGQIEISPLGKILSIGPFAVINGNVTIEDLEGVGDRMVVADEDGVLSTQAIPSGAGTDDQIASEVPFTPYSTLASTNVQDAIEELLDESSGGSMDWSIPVDSDIVPDITNTYQIGSGANRFNNIYTHTINASSGADLNSADITTGNIEILNIGNFSSDPASTIEGRIYYNDVAKELRYYNGTSYVSTGGVGSTDAADINISDGTGYYTSGNVEGALDEVAGVLGGLGALATRNTITTGYITNGNVTAEKINGAGSNGDVLTSDGAGNATWAAPSGGGSNNDLYTYEELTGDITLDATDFDSGKKVFYNNSSTNYTVTVPDVASAGEKVLFKQRGSGAIIIETPTIEIKTIDSTATVGLSKDPFGYDPMGSWEYYSSSFGKYLPITIQSSQVSGSSDLTNMPILINLDNIDSEIMDADGTNDALNGGGDIRFYEDIAGTSPLAIEVVQFVTNATEGTRRAQIWAKIPTLSYDTDTVIYMGFGNGETSQPAADSTYGSEAVWTDFAFVSHDTHSDSSGNTTVTDNVTASSASPFGGISGDFTGSSNNNNASLSHADLTGGLTVMTWANTTNTTGYLRALHLHDGTNEIQLMKGGGEGNYYFFSESNGTGTVVRSSATFSASTWEFYAMTHTAFKTNQKIYKAGVDVTTSSAEGIGAGLTTEGIFMASRNNPSNGYNGYLSEVMVLEEAWSADKIKTLYNNLNSPSTFAIEGTIVE